MKKPAERAGGKATKARADAGDSVEAGETAADTDGVAPEATGTEIAGTPAAAAEEATEAPAAATPEPTAEPPSPEEQVAELKDRLLRAMAETENVRRRAERDREEAQKYAVTGLARDLVGIVDNLHRAIEAAPGIADEEEGGLKSLLVGVEMTQRELLVVLERHDIRAINPIGEKFDPNYHQAMFEVPNSGQAPGTVVQVMQPGYVIGERLLRPAMVGVAAAAAGDEEGEGGGAARGSRIDTTV